MNVLMPLCFRKIRIVASNGKPVAAGRRRTVPDLGGLMPYEAAAKAIFIRANGAAAYYQATGIVPCANEPTAGDPGVPSRANQLD